MEQIMGEVLLVPAEQQPKPKNRRHRQDELSCTRKKYGEPDSSQLKTQEFDKRIVTQQSHALFAGLRSLREGGCLSCMIFDELQDLPVERLSQADKSNSDLICQKHYFPGMRIW